MVFQFGPFEAAQIAKRKSCLGGEPLSHGPDAGSSILVSAGGTGYLPANSGCGTSKRPGLAEVQRPTWSEEIDALRTEWCGASQTGC